METAVKCGRRRSGRSLRPAAVFIFGLLFLVGCGRAPAPPPPESLHIRINLLCTTCDDFLRCERTVDAGRDQVYRLYRLREKSFWAQVATIWDYLVQWVHRNTVDTRPLTIYENEGVDRRLVTAEGRARIDGVIGLITLPDSSIEMRTGDWRDSTGELQGRCHALKRREGYAWVRSLLGRELPVRGSP